MRMPTDVRVKTSDLHAGLYQDLKPLCGEFHSIFYLCACLGYSRDRKAASGRKRSERFFSGTITSDEWTTYYAMAFRDSGMNLQAVHDDRAVVDLAQDYADGGMEYLVENPLRPLLLRGKDGEIRLDTKASKELAFELAKLIWEEVETQNAAGPAR